MTAIELPFPLLADIADARCIPFLGAGFSKNAHVTDGAMPDWSALANDLASEGGLDANRSGPEVAQEYERRFGRVQLIEAVRRALHPDDSTPGQAHMAFVHLPFDTVYTTNFDLLLEQAYSSAGRPFRSLVGELQLPFHAGQTATSIVKMHGDLRHEEHIVLTRGDYDVFLARYPVVATHLSAMLITRTPLFIGYSLTDPDFLSIRAVVKSRLGQFERMSYVVQLDASDQDKDAALEDRIHIVNLKTNGRNRDEVLARLFSAASARLDRRASSRLRSSRPDVFESVAVTLPEQTSEPQVASALTESTSTLCFVMMPFADRFDRVYRELIAPAASDAGLSPVRSDEMAGSGFVMEQIRAAIQQSRLCIADITDRNPNVLYELGFAQAMSKSVILLAADLTDLPFDLRSMRVIRYGAFVGDARAELRAAIAQELTVNRFAEVEQLLAAGAYRAAIAMAGLVIEHVLRELVNRHDVPTTKTRGGIGQLATALKREGLIDVNLRAAIDDVVRIRNRAVHSLEHEPSREEAQMSLDMAKRLAAIA